MSIDKSLVSKNKLSRDRNVYSRFERIKLLKNEESWTEEDSVFGLPKVKVQRMKKRTKKVKEKKEEGADAAAGKK